MSVMREIKQIRTERGLSQEALAERVNVSRQTIYKWENGLSSPSGENLVQLSKALGVPVDALLNGGWTPPETQVVEVPIEVPAPRPGRRRLWALLAALALAGGIILGALLFWRQHDNVVSSSELESEVIDPSTVGEYIPLLPPE